jgi:hypothetical protein
MQFSWRALVSVSVSSMIGGAIFISMARYRYKLQMWGFLILAVFLIAVGATFVTLLGGRYFAAIIVLYFFTQLFFDFGKLMKSLPDAEKLEDTLTRSRSEYQYIYYTRRGFPDAVSCHLPRNLCGIRKAWEYHRAGDSSSVSQ